MDSEEKIEFDKETARLRAECESFFYQATIESYIKTCLIGQEEKMDIVLYINLVCEQYTKLFDFVLQHRKETGSRRMFALFKLKEHITEKKKEWDKKKWVFRFDIEYIESCLWEARIHCSYSLEPFRYINGEMFNSITKTKSRN